MSLHCPHRSSLHHLRRTFQQKNTQLEEGVVELEAMVATLSSPVVGRKKRRRLSEIDPFRRSYRTSRW